MFGLNLSFGIFIGDDAFRSLNNDAVEEIHRDITVPTISATHRERRQRELEREILADQESLYILEAATAANSEKAEKLDQESLAILMDITKSLEIRQKGFVTPIKASYHRGASQSNILYGTPLFGSPSFSTPQSFDSNSATLKSTNEREGFLASGVTASKAAIAVAKKTSWEKLSAKLAAAGWSQSSIEAVVDTRRDCLKGQADSVYGWFDRLQQKDADDEWKMFELQLQESIVTPVSSSNSERGGFSYQSIAANSEA